MSFTISDVEHFVDEPAVPLVEGIPRLRPREGVSAVVTYDGVRGHDQVVPGGLTHQVSRLVGESRWTVDGESRGNLPVFYNGRGARFCRLSQIHGEVAEALSGCEMG